MPVDDVRIADTKRFLRDSPFRRDDYGFFSDLNSIMLDKTRVFPSYDQDERLQSSRKSLTSLLGRIGSAYVASYLDVGCGMGYFPAAAATLGAKCSVGIDLVEHESWNYYKGNLSESESALDYLTCDILKSPLEGKFQLVTSFNTFEHFDDPEAMLLRMSGLVADGGWLNIRFAPIWRSWGGAHMYRRIGVPWYHLIFSDSVVNRFYGENNIKYSVSPDKSVVEIHTNRFNKWSAIDFFLLFTRDTPLRLLNFSAIWDREFEWFLDLVNHELRFSMQELLLSGFNITYGKL